MQGSSESSWRLLWGSYHNRWLPHTTEREVPICGSEAITGHKIKDSRKSNPQAGCGTFLSYWRRFGGSGRPFSGIKQSIEIATLLGVEGTNGSSSSMYGGRSDHQVGLDKAPTCCPVVHPSKWFGVSSDKTLV